ncbi:MAG TPA: hypothetical protein VGK99_04515 [Acidobacteriota bacterium]
MTALVTLLVAASPFAHPEFAAAKLSPNAWTELHQSMTGGRRGCAVRYAPDDGGGFLLWGFMNSDPDLLQEQPLMEIPEYDMVRFDPDRSVWSNHLPPEWEQQWNRKLPLAYVPRTYSGITTGSERTVLRGPTAEQEGAPRPDLNIVFDQVTYVPSRKSLVYFTGGLTAAYDVAHRRWSDLAPSTSPPPVVGGSLAFNPLQNEVLLFGGGHVAEPGPRGGLVGYTGMWAYRFQDSNWHRLNLSAQPEPRMNTRMVLDSRNHCLVLFGGDAQSHYLTDTWIYDLRRGEWRASRASSGPEARAGHFTVYDPATGWVIVGGGYNRRDLEDMWAYDVAGDRWLSLQGRVPTGFYITADIDPERHLIVLLTNTRTPGDRTTCNVLYPVRTTYGYRIDPAGILSAAGRALPPENIPKAETAPQTAGLDAALQIQQQSQRLQALPVNQWTPLSNPARNAPTRTWGSATFDSDRGLILYWGGGHCGYGGSDVDAYSVREHTWLRRDPAPEYPERAWDHGVRLAGVTFQGKPWTDHGRRIYTYDPVSRKMIMVRPIRLTEGYDPPLPKMKEIPALRWAAADALVKSPGSYVKYTTWTYDPDTAQWRWIGAAPEGLDTLLSTPHGAVGVDVFWPGRLNDAGYMLPWNTSQPENKAIFLLDAGTGNWTRLSKGSPAPQHLYEMTSLAYDTRRDQVLLHGAGEQRNELWAFSFQTRSWRKLVPKVEPPSRSVPSCSREAVYIPRQDVFLTYGPDPEKKSAPAMWEYSVGENTWRRIDIPFAGDTGIDRVGQNRAMVYDPRNDVVLLVLGPGGDKGQASVCALRYRKEK